VYLGRLLRFLPKAEGGRDSGISKQGTELSMIPWDALPAELVPQVVQSVAGIVLNSQQGAGLAGTDLENIARLLQADSPGRPEKLGALVPEAINVRMTLAIFGGVFLDWQTAYNKGRDLLVKGDFNRIVPDLIQEKEDLERKVAAISPKSREDLVAWQLKVAMGEPLPAHWEHVEAQGHAIEARLYAENPRRGFLPSMGQVQSLCFPEAAAQFDVSAPIRIDAGIREGDVISGDYDPMIAKIIVHGKDRQQALASMRQALAASSVLGPSNNRAFLQKLIDHPAVQAGQLSTALIEREIDSLAGALSPQRKA